jgi:UDP-N-acetylmuramoyl-L-alanyl-D-glutamate--2,6-diaminopimelate ligase
MKLAELAKQIGSICATGNMQAEARDVTHDSRQCKPGAVFVAIQGEKVDAHRFIPQAVEQGAVAVISERSKIELAAATERCPAWIQVADARLALAEAAAAVHSHPSHRLKLVGVTGTNGKTTTAHLIDSIIRASEGKSALLGTISYRIGSNLLPAHHTTPEASDIQRMLAQAVKAGCCSAVMEVSSHAIELRRAGSLKFAVAVFTNLSRDHLDYHRSMENYFAAKRKLFDGSLGYDPGASVINIDDEYGRKLLEYAKGSIITYGFSPSAEVRADCLKLSADGLVLTAITPSGQIDISSPLVGRPNAYNILAAIAAGLALGADLELIAHGISECRGIAGRFERVTLDGQAQPGFTVIVDYAHTDAALGSVLETAREIAAKGRIITVFGCGGDRDKSKRAPMGATAARLSDVVIVTSDNPRSEDPEKIIEDIEVGLKRVGKPYLKFLDRRQAIFQAIEMAQEGDLVLIAGKGHENYQIIGDRTIRFDDAEVAREALMKKR